MSNPEPFDVLCLCPDDSPSTPSEDTRRHPDLWFSDGSVVLRARNVLFRVHITLLARRSPVFSDMFSLPQPPGDAEGCEMIEGCPVIDLFDDPEDLANLLMAHYDGPSFGDNGVADFRVSSSVLRLATKYDLEDLRKRTLTHLSHAWPSTLEGWDAREERARIYEYDTGEALYPSPIAVINLAREVNAPSLLPSAFYDLSRYTFAQIFECAACAPASAPTSPPAFALPPSGSTRPHVCALTHTLRPADLQRLALGKEACAAAVGTVIAAISRGPPHALVHARRVSASTSGAASASAFASSGSATPPHPSCASPGTCRRDFAELAALATQHYVCERERGAADPLYVAEELGALQGVEAGECRACARSLEGWARRERERLWRAVSVWFRVDGEV